MVHTTCKLGLSFFMRALQILLENLQRFVDDDDAEVESQICHVKLMNDSLCRILVGGGRRVVQAACCFNGVWPTSVGGLTSPVQSFHRSSCSLSGRRAAEPRCLRPSSPVRLFPLRGLLTQLLVESVNMCLVLLVEMFSIVFSLGRLLIEMSVLVRLHL